jgi:hypothetical protein
MYPFPFATFLPQPPYHMDSTPIHKFSAPKGEFLEPPQSSKPITTSNYELKPGFIAMVQAQSFSRLILIPTFRNLSTCVLASLSPA